ncbi:Cupredoxin [Bisporella sp. PMI_857]|nr:Cupredoxin [Bisporella sp. PMI_857]
MKYSAVAVLCAAPLVLAGSFFADLTARGQAELEVRSNHESEKKESNNKEVTVVEATNSDIIIIWVNNGGGAATQTITETKTVTAGATEGAAAAAATHTVTVGGPGGLIYSPESISAAVGDMVVFTFLSNNHTATQSAFDTPCKKLADGVDSGFMANVNNTIVPAPQMAMQVTVATPIWFYCRQTKHCGQGMTFSINPTAEKTQAQFKQLAIAQNGTGTVSPIAGGSAVAPPPAAATTAAPAAAAPATPPAAAAPATGSGVVGGSGEFANGACSCACLCGTAAFPNAAVQGVGAFGGMAG